MTAFNVWYPTQKRRESSAFRANTFGEAHSVLASYFSTITSKVFVISNLRYRGPARYGFLCISILPGLVRSVWCWRLQFVRRENLTSRKARPSCWVANTSTPIIYHWAGSHLFNRARALYHLPLWLVNVVWLFHLYPPWAFIGLQFWQFCPIFIRFWRSSSMPR